MIKNVLLKISTLNLENDENITKRKVSVKYTKTRFKTVTGY